MILSKISQTRQISIVHAENADSSPATRPITGAAPVFEALQIRIAGPQ
jgi:hypothetical protein